MTRRGLDGLAGLSLNNGENTQWSSGFFTNLTFHEDFWERTNHVAHIVFRQTRAC